MVAASCKPATATRPAFSSERPVHRSAQPARFRATVGRPLPVGCQPSCLLPAEPQPGQPGSQPGAHCCLPACLRACSVRCAPRRGANPPAAHWSGVINFAYPRIVGRWLVFEPPKVYPPTPSCPSECLRTRDGFYAYALGHGHSSGMLLPDSGSKGASLCLYDMICTPSYPVFEA